MFASIKASRIQAGVGIHGAWAWASRELCSNTYQSIKVFLWGEFLITLFETISFHMLLLNYQSPFQLIAFSPAQMHSH